MFGKEKLIKQEYYLRIKDNVVFVFLVKDDIKSNNDKHKIEPIRNRKKQILDEYLRIKEILKILKRI